jgi:hypothetical protein
MERARAVDPANRKAARNFLSDVFWALLNSTEFTFNH